MRPRSGWALVAANIVPVSRIDSAQPLGSAAEPWLKNTAQLRHFSAFSEAKTFYSSEVLTVKITTLMNLETEDNRFIAKVGWNASNLTLTLKYFLRIIRYDPWTPILPRGGGQEEKVTDLQSIKFAALKG